MTTVPAELAAPPTDEPVLVEDAGGVRILTLNRPNARNAIDLATAQAIEATVDSFESDADLRVMIIAANGPAFCAGMDLKAFLRGERPSTVRRGFAGLVERLPTKPTIAAVEGPAMAGGFEIVLACDIIVAAESASFALPEVKRGLVAAGGAAPASSTPAHRAMELALTGATLTAIAADDLGLLEPVDRTGRRLGDRAGTGRVDHRQRSIGRLGHQAHPGRVALNLATRRSLLAAARHRRRPARLPLDAQEGARGRSSTSSPPVANR